MTHIQAASWIATLGPSLIGCAWAGGNERTNIGRRGWRSPVPGR